MTIGLLKLELSVPGAHSLKDKRRVVKSLKEKIRNRYNCSIAEVGEKDHWTYCQLAACVVGDDSRFVNTQLNEIVHYAENNANAIVTSVNIEML